MAEVDGSGGLSRSRFVTHPGWRNVERPDYPGNPPLSSGVAPDQILRSDSERVYFHPYSPRWPHCVYCGQRVTQRVDVLCTYQVFAVGC